MTVLDAGAKECTSCGHVKPLDEYRSHPRSRDGRHYWCRQCERDYQSDYYYGLRRRDLGSGDRAHTGPFICLCKVARPDPARCQACRGCGYPVVARMHPEPRARALAKWPDLADEQVEPHESRAVAA